MEFATVCTERNLSVPALDGSIAQLAQLVLEREAYAVPVFACFRPLALPIASEWILSGCDKSTIFCRLTTLAPLLSELQFLTEHFLDMHSNTLLEKLDQIDAVLYGVLALVLHNHGRFANYFSADAVRSIANTENLSRRMLALATLAQLMEVSERQLDTWCTQFCGSDSTQFQFEAVLIKARVSAADAQLLAVGGQPLTSAQMKFENQLITNIGGVFVARLGGLPASSGGFVETKNATANLRHAAENLLNDRPLLLRGPRGSGKTCISEFLHDRMRGRDMVRIHLGDQTDAKALVGNYTAGAKPGTFKWTAGALTTAVLQGRWVLIEDIDRAPNEIVAVLISLLERRELVIPSRDEVVRAAPGFQIVATTSAESAEIIGSRSWATVGLDPPTSEDLEEIIRSVKPFMSTIVAQMLVTVLQRVEEWQERHSATRSATSRDLMKLVRRIGPKYDTDDMFREAVACFTSFLPQPWALIEVIADAMGVASSRVHPLLERHTPSVSVSDSRLVIGRAELERRSVTASAARNLDAELEQSRFALTQPTLKLLEDISVSVEHAEPLLLVGETGTGKTAVVQYLAKLARRKLVVINVSQQVETGDLIGGFKPVDARQLAGPILEDFAELFDSTFSRAKNHQFVEVLDKVVARQQWNNVIKLLREAVKLANNAKISEKTGKRAKTDGCSSSAEWSQFASHITAFEERIKEVQQSAQFQFIEGLLVRAIRQGHWVLLDELNLAPADTIEGIGELLSSRMITLLESGGQVVHAHPTFRLFANMNPATDAGKRDLPAAVRTKFTELWSPSPDTDPEALRAIIARYLPSGTEGGIVNDTAQLYTEARELVNQHQLADGAGQRPHFSIRTLVRALSTASTITPTYGLRRALYEAFSMCFLTLLDAESAEKLSTVLAKWLLDKLPNRNSVMKQIPREPTDGKYVLFGHWWMPCGNGEVVDVSNYILTPSVEANLLNLVRATSTKKFPVLIQGPTSSGKTSMISYLAKRTGHNIVRINNHEHTDLAEYLGGYESDSDGKLVFKEGALVTALRHGDWLILDELNLAPTDVLEALNRLLDDNRELLVPETQEIIKPHPDFVLFATQNPPGLYAGRKVLSRAFRNRFLELHFGDIPEQELEIILRDRSGIAPSYAAKIVEVYRELARNKIQRVFEQAATLRDLFRWAQRSSIGYEQLAFNGYVLLGERSRTQQERQEVRSVIERVMRVPIETEIAQLASEEVMAQAPPDIVWTNAMKRVLALVQMALDRNEPVLLVGETGCGKTTIVQALAAAQQQKLIILNAHQNTETGDLVGSQRPVRQAGTNRLFEWVDGPLVTALKEGDFFLLDEISLADDSVLERLNSVLEPERTLFVPEIGAVEARHGFQFLATMNPGGDYGKKELSPALRNRFTEIWVPIVDDANDLSMIISRRLKECDFNSAATQVIVEFSKWFSREFGIVSLRDILSWTAFLNATGLTPRNVMHGACMVFIDGLGIQSQLMASPELIRRARGRCLRKLGLLLNEDVEMDDAHVVQQSNGEIQIGDFSISDAQSNGSVFSLAAPTSALNAMRVLRAMQVRKPVLLEGSPGAGKTSLISALAKLKHVPLTRINLSDQTDLADLFGQDVPLDEPGKFGWRNAPFLRAMQHGEWVLLDEMNLAPQPVLEGLNACLDHRGEAYIPELDRVFSKHPNFVVFAAQNPQVQGGGRKGLPKSLLNRFSIVYVDQLGLPDLHAIVASTHPNVEETVREKLCSFVEELAQWSMNRVLSGGPFEFNLRDTLRWLDLVQATGNAPQQFLDLIVVQRLRSASDKHTAEQMFAKYFPAQSLNLVNPVDISAETAKVGAVSMSRGVNVLVHGNLKILPSQLAVIESAMQCINLAWPLILVGSSGSGKTSLIRLLAQLQGSKLVQFSMTADIDSTDLLGEFDQLEYQSELQRLWSSINDLVTINEVEHTALIDAVRVRNLTLVESLLPVTSPVHEKIADFNKIDFSRPVFHWVDGMLVKAVERGDWLVLDNANLCSAAVLDRLNSLLERGGSLFISECSNNDGSPREVKPHPDFRLFLTVNPKYGELSRAMRNRGVELWLEKPVTDSIYSKETAQGLTVGGAMPIAFTKPYTVAHLSDIHSNSWLRVLLFDHRTPLKYVTDADIAAFGEFVAGTTDIALLYDSFFKFRLQRTLSNAMNAVTADNLLTLSALRRARDSIECDFDVYGIIETALQWIVGGGELGSVLMELVDTRDPSRIPVFRNWLLDYAGKRQLSQLSEAVKLGLGQQYDFSQGGVGMERMWQKYGRPLGFNTASAHTNYVKTLVLAQKFDAMVSKLGPQHSAQIAEIRRALATLIANAATADEPIVAAVEAFKDCVVSQSFVHQPKLLDIQFKELWNSLALVYVVKQDVDLITVLAQLSSAAEISTLQLESVLQTDIIRIPDLVVPPALESTLLDAIQRTKQGQAESELQELQRTLDTMSWHVAESMSPDALVLELVKSTVAKIQLVVPDFNFTLPSSAAGASVELAKQLLFLYVCPLPLDPAIAQHVWYERYIALKQQLADDDECWAEMQKVFGSESETISQWLANRNLKQVPVPSIWRPDQSAMAVVHRHMVASSELAQSAAQPGQRNMEEIDVILLNAEHLSSQLFRATGYRDLVSTVRSALSLLKIGMNLQQRGFVGTSNTLMFLNPITVSALEDCTEIVESDMYLLALRSVKCLRMVPTSIQTLFDAVHRQWTLKRLRIEEEQREKAAGFKYTDDDDDKAEQEFRLMFPDFDELPEVPISRESSDIFTREFVLQYCKLFNKQAGSGDIVETLVHAAETLTSASGTSSCNNLSALYLALKKRLNASHDQSSGSSFNFYLDSNSAESTSSVAFAEKVGLHMEPLLEMWPEHDILQTLYRIASEICLLPPGAPVALYLSKVEQIHHYLYEWDRFASKEFKFSDLMADCTTLIVRWRRLELATWPPLFDVETRKAAMAATPFWYHLYETLVSAASDDLPQIAKVLIIFLSESTVGQFGMRLQLLEAFEGHLALLNSSDVRQCVSNVRLFFTQFLPGIKSQLATLERQLRKQVDDVVRLASWRDANIHALKQSAQRSHRQLFKFVKKFRSVLESKVVTDNTVPSLFPSTVVPLAPRAPSFKWSAKWLVPVINSKEWKSRPRHLQELPGTLKLMEGYVSEIRNRQLFDELDSLARNIIVCAKKLREETPKSWTKKTKKLISALKVEKQKLFTETLRELRRSGLKSAVTKKTLADQLELTRVLASTPSLEDGPFADQQFFALIELLPKLRAAVSDAATNDKCDVPINDLQRGLALAENAFSQVLKLRKIASRHLEGLRDINSLQESLAELASKPAAMIFETSSVEKVQEVAHVGNNVMRTVDAVIAESTDSSGANTASVRAALNEFNRMSVLDLQTSRSIEWLAKLADSLKAVQSTLGTAGGLIASNIDTFHGKVAAQTLVSKHGVPTFSVAHDTVVSVSNVVLVVVQQIVKQLAEQQLKQSNSMADGDTDEEEDDDTDWLVSSLSTAQKALLSLHKPEIAKRLDIATTNIFDLSAEHPEEASGLAASLLVFAEGYAKLSDAVEQLYAKLLFSTTMGALQLSALLHSLATDGFCSPQPTEDGSDDEQDQKGDGVGLGDGKGQSSSTKDIDEEDDDVAEAMQTSNPKQEEKEEADDRKDDKAKEMEGEMAGQTEDFPPQDSAEEEKDADEEEQDPEDEIGDLDDLDPNAVDEKIWDDQKNEPDQKEKQSDQNVDGVKDHDDMAADKNDENQMQDSGNPGEGNQEENDEAHAESGNDAEGSDAESDAENDDVNQADNGELDAQTEQKEALELPENLDLEDDGEEDAGEDEDADGVGDMADQPTDALDGQEDTEAEKEADNAKASDEEESAETEEEVEQDAEKAADDADDEAMEDEDEAFNDAMNDTNDADDAAMDVDNDQQGDEQGADQGADIDGLHGMDDEDSKPEVDQATTTENHTESSGQGASEDASAERSNVGTGGSFGANQDKPEDTESAQNEQQEQLRESLKQLGDALKEFHLRQQAIREHEEREDPTEEDVESSSNVDDPLKGDEEVVHVGAEEAFDTQALGKTTNEERQQIDESMGIDDEEEGEQHEVAGDEEDGAEHGAGGDIEAMAEEEGDEDGDDDAQPVANAGHSRIDEDEDEGEDAAVKVGIFEESQQAGATDLWQTYEAKTQDLALVLGEQLRLILDPTIVSKLRGDYRTGKRLNMKRIIPYIASEFRKNKIWLRRSKPAKREYQVLLALDDSKSMGEPAVVDLAFQAIALVGKALSSIEAGKMAIAKFGTHTEFVHGMDESFTAQRGNHILQQFGFNQQRTNMHELLERSLDIFSEHSTASEQWRLEIIMSDGITDDHHGLRKLVRRAYDERVMLVFIVLDALNRDTSILDMNEVRYATDSSGNQKLEVVKYMDDFPFDYYVIVRDIGDLPMVLASVLRQYFQAVDL